MGICCETYFLSFKNKFIKFLFCAYFEESLTTKYLHKYTNRKPYFFPTALVKFRISPFRVKADSFCLLGLIHHLLRALKSFYLLFVNKRKKVKNTYLVPGSRWIAQTGCFSGFLFHNRQLLHQ